MKQAWVVLAAGLMLGALAAQAKLPAPPPKTEAQKKAEADKAAAAKAHDAAELAKAEERAVANYKRNHGGANGSKKQ
jgi:hypothetical protein